MKLSRVKPLALATGLGLFAASLAGAAVAGDVYQWKDAKGVTQYSSTPPPKGNYKVRTINNAGAATHAVTADASVAENAQCGPARKNIVVLQGKGPVQQDSDGDGKAEKTLTDSERASQLALAQAVINANNCTASATASIQK